MNLAQSLQANLGVLEGANQRDELLYRSGKLAYDIAKRHHHAESHPALHHRTSGEEGDQYICGLAEKDRSQLLILLQGQSLHPNLKQFHLDAFPLPAHPCLAVV